MRAVLLAVAAILLVAGAAVMGFVAGRAGVPDDRAPAISERTRAPITGIPGYALPAEDRGAPSTPRTDLVRALGQPAPERDRAVRLAMNAWLVAEGAAAIMAARSDPQLGDTADRMMQLALYVYPELIVDNPELLEGMPEQSLAMAVSGMAAFNPDAARAMIDSHLSGSMFGDAMLSMVDHVERQDFPAQPLQDPRAELEAILEERGMLRRMPRLHQLVTRVAADDPVVAAELIDDMPGSLRQHAVQALVEVWSRTNPEQAGRWLESKNVQVSEQGFHQLAFGWGERDFEAANAFADTLAGRRRAAFLAGLSSATHRLSNDEVRAWVSRYENDPAYPMLIVNSAQRLLGEDVDAVIDLIETLPEEARAPSYRSVLPSLAFEDPEAAVALIDDIGDESVRDEVLPMVSGIWADHDAEAALDWALGLAPGVARDRALAAVLRSLVVFDTDRAVDVINEIDDAEVRRGPVRQLLFAAESDDEAIRLGRAYGFDRDAVLEMRDTMRGTFFAPYPSTVSFGFVSAKDAEAE